MNKLFPMVLAACLAAPMAAAFAQDAAKKTGLSYASASARTTRRGAPLRGVRMGRVFTQPAPAYFH